MRVGVLAALWLAAVQPVAAQPADPAPNPPWVAEVVGYYAGVVRNEGRMECQRTVFALQAGHLVGHYWIDAVDPFEGELTGFVAEGADSGRFTWTDRDGAGVERVVFAADHASFVGEWGVGEPDQHNQMWGQRGG